MLTALPTMKIDAHQHYWLLAARAGQWPPPALAPIHRDFLPADLQPLLQAAGISGTVLVQSLPSAADTDFLLALADREASVFGVVGWADLKAVDAPVRIAVRAQHPKLKGLRPMLQALPDDWLDDPALSPAAEAMAAHGLVFDALVLPRQLPALWRFAARHPALTVVIDHAAKPPIASGQLAVWRQDMARLAALPQVHCKLSGLLTEAGELTGNRAGFEALRPYVDTLWQLFGAARLLWGSDWPVLRLAADYAEWLALSEELLASLSPAPDAAQRQAVFGANAQALYRLQAVAHATPG